MFGWLKELDISLEEPVPSLFTFNLPGHPIRELMGVSLERVRVKIAGTSLEEEGPLLITHWGLSGPAILRLSAWGARELAQKKYEFSAHINWLHKQGYNEQSIREAFSHHRSNNPSRQLYSNNFAELPQRLWQFLLAQSGISREMRFGDLPRKVENLLIKNLVDYTVAVKGKTTFKEEFVMQAALG
jgi:predicted flavoprotein YhiN